MKTMKKLIPLFLCLVLAVGLLPLIASPATAYVYNDGDWQFTAEGSDATIVAYKGSASSVTIPATLETAITCTVKAIDNGAFYKNTTVTSVTFASGSTVTTIDNGAFEDCTNLTSITFPSTLKVIGSRAFCGCGKLAEAAIPDGVTTIGMTAFYGTALTSVRIPSSVTSVGDQAFGFCTEMTTLKNYAHLTGFGDGAFTNCWALKEVVIPQGMTTLSDSLFDGCGSLEKITIPDTVTSVGSFAFRDCDKLNLVLYQGYVDDWNEIEIDSYDNSCLTNSTIYYVPQEYNSGDWVYTVSGRTGELTLCKYKGSAASVTVPETISGSYVTRLWQTFKNNTTITSVVLPDSVQKISYETFYGCSKLANVTIADDVEVIGTHAFYGCTSLKDLTLPDSITRIEFQAFGGTGFTSFTIPTGCSSIGDMAFTACLELTSVHIPDSVTQIGNKVFYYCSKLAKVYYYGTAAQWDNILIGASNSALNKAAFYCIPEAPVLQTPKAAEGGMELNWNAVRGAAQYRVYRRDNEKGTWSGWSQVATGVKKNTWTDPNVTPGKQYKYRIKAYGVAWSEYSNAETALMTVFVPAPTLTVTAGSGKASLSWTAVSGASQYRVYRRDNEKGSWSGWSTVCSKVIGTTWDDTTVIPGKQYKYEVRAYAGGTWSDYSNPAAVKIPIAPVLTVTANTGANSLSWTAISGATQYRVYRRDNESGSWTGWSMVKRVTDGTSWDDTDIISGKSYKYQVRAYVGGAWTDYSNAVTVKAK